MTVKSVFDSPREQISSPRHCVPIGPGTYPFILLPNGYCLLFLLEVKWSGREANLIHQASKFKKGRYYDSLLLFVISAMLLNYTSHLLSNFIAIFITEGPSMCFYDALVQQFWFHRYTKGSEPAFECFFKDRRDSVVRIVTRLQAGRQEVRIPVDTKRLFSSSEQPDWPLVHPACYRYWGPILGAKRPDVKLPVKLHILPRLRMSGPILLTPLHAFMARTNFALFSLLKKVLGQLIKHVHSFVSFRSP
jgi:hypothetical protein